MNDWSRLAVDLNEKQKLGGRKKELHQYKYAPDKRRTGPRPFRKRELTNPTVGRRAEDNSVCPLTNTYHEWPDMWGFIPLTAGTGQRPASFRGCRLSAKNM